MEDCTKPDTKRSNEDCRMPESDEEEDEINWDKDDEKGKGNSKGAVH